MPKIFLAGLRSLFHFFQLRWRDVAVTVEDAVVLFEIMLSGIYSLSLLLCVDIPVYILFGRHIVEGALCFVLCDLTFCCTFFQGVGRVSDVENNRIVADNISSFFF